MTRHRLGIGLAWLAAGVLVAAQSPAGTPRFEISSIRLNRSGEPFGRQQAQPGGRFVATNSQPRALIRFAYELQDFQLEGGPDWLTKERYDISARADHDASLADVRLMLRTLLAERFQLRVRTTRTEQPVYALVVARGDGVLGTQLKPTALDCARPVAPEPANPRVCGYFGPSPDLPISAARLSFRGLDLDVFARSLGGLVRRPVLNRTGLIGFFDGDFDATAELPPPPPPPGFPEVVDRQNLPSIFSVVRDQLGLKLESTRAMVDAVAIESIERPTDD